MKKFFYSAFAASMMLIAASCSSEEELVTNGVGADEGQAVSFTIETGAVESRAAGEGLKVNEVHYEVWSGNELIISTIEGRKPLMPADAQPMANGKATVKMNLVRNVSYDISFWAQNKENNCHKACALESLAGTQRKRATLTAFSLGSMLHSWAPA